MEDEIPLKSISLTYAGEYSNEQGDECIATANLYLTFSKPKASFNGRRVSHTITVRVPRKGENTLYRTSTKSYNWGTSGDDLKAYLDTSRKVRDELFLKEHGFPFSAANAKKLKGNSIKSSHTGKSGLTVSKQEHLFKVMYRINGKKNHKNYPLVNYGSEDAAYVEAYKFLDIMSGRAPRTVAEYLAIKPGVVFPDFATNDYEYTQRVMREIKDTVVIEKSGVEVIAKTHLLGFFANYYAELGRGGRKGQRRTSFNARELGEDNAFIQACREKDTRSGCKQLSDEEYLKLKPANIFGRLI